MTAPGGDSGERAPDEANQPPAAGQTSPDSPGFSGFESPPPPPISGYPPAYPPSAYPPSYPPYPPLGGYPPPGYQEPPGYGGSSYPPLSPEYGAPAASYGQPYPGGYPTPGYHGGYPAPAYSGPYGPSQPSATNTLAIASLISSFVGVLCCIGSIVGIVLGAVALSQIKQTRQEGYGLAVAGIVIGVATLLVSLIIMIFAMR